MVIKSTKAKEHFRQQEERNCSVAGTPSAIRFTDSHIKGRENDDVTTHVFL